MNILLKKERGKKNQRCCRMKRLKEKKKNTYVDNEHILKLDKVRHTTESESTKTVIYLKLKKQEERSPT